MESPYPRFNAEAATAVGAFSISLFFWSSISSLARTSARGGGLAPAGFGVVRLTRNLAKAVFQPWSQADVFVSELLDGFHKIFMAHAFFGGDQRFDGPSSVSSASSFVDG